MLAVVLLVVVAQAASGETPQWLVPFGGAGAGAFAIMAAGFMTDRLHTGTALNRLREERDEAYARERETADYVRDHVVPLLGRATEAIAAANRLVEKVTE